MIDPITSNVSQVKNNLVQQYQGKQYSYDAQGNMVEARQSGHTLKLTWDNLNRLIQSDNNGQITAYGYDVFGRRLYKQSENQLTLFGWDGDLMVWESKQYQQESKKIQNYTKHYVYEPNSFVPALQTGYHRFITLIPTPNYDVYKTQPYSIHKDSVWKTDTRKNKVELERAVFYHCDQVGTPQTLSNERGECVWEIELSTWGKVQQVKSNNQNEELELTHIRFQGQYYDEETGLHYNRYRYYEPYSGRYVSKDPIGLSGGFNNLAYVNDPNQWVDPMGLITLKPIEEPKDNEYNTSETKIFGKAVNISAVNYGVNKAIKTISPLNLYPSDEKGVLGEDKDGVPYFDPKDSDYHKHIVVSACKRTSKCTPEEAWLGLLMYPTPFASGKPIVDEQVGAIPGIGTVRTEVYSKTKTIINVTLSGQHMLYPGKVTREIKYDNNNVYIITTGEGVGDLKWFNNAGAKILWQTVDKNICDRMK